MYQKALNDRKEVRKDVIFRESDNAWIPCDPANRDYQEFLKHCVREKITMDDLKLKDL